MSKQNMCSCTVCKKQFSNKGIGTHYVRAHTSTSKRQSGKGTRIFIKYVHCINCHCQISVQILKRHHIRCIKPTPICKNPICNNTAVKKYCSHSCAAIVNNTNRNEVSRKKQGAALLQNKELSQKIKLKTNSIRKIKSRICAVCSKIDTTTGRFQSDKCMFCNDSLTYRESCRFKFNLKTYPNEFDLTLLTSIGMFNPKSNKNGISRDHKVSVSYGKTHRIDPKIMSHPANCQLLTQYENKKSNIIHQ